MSDAKRGCVLDTNIFNWILNGRLSMSCLPRGCVFYVTRLQRDEINRTQDISLRQALLDVFEAVSPVPAPTESMVWGKWGFGDAKFSDGVTYQKIKAILDERDRASNIEDALIAEVALKRGWLLATADRRLHHAASQCGVETVYFDNPGRTTAAE